MINKQTLNVAADIYLFRGLPPSKDEIPSVKSHIESLLKDYNQAMSDAKKVFLSLDDIRNCFFPSSKDTINLTLVIDHLNYKLEKLKELEFYGSIPQTKKGI